MAPYFQGPHDNSVVGPGKLGAPKDFALLDKSQRTYCLTLRLSVLSGVLFGSTPATPLGDIHGLLGPKALGRSRYISPTALRHLLDFGLEFNAEFSKFRIVLLNNVLVPEMAHIQPNVLGWRHRTRFEPYFQCSHEKSVDGLGKLGASKTAALDTPPATAHEYKVDRFPCTTVTGIPSPAVQVRSLEPRSSYPESPNFRKVKEH